MLIKSCWRIIIIVSFISYSSPQFSPEGSPWNGDDSNSSYNQRTSVKMEADEPLGSNSTISPVLYANVNHPELRTDYPCKLFFQILLIFILRKYVFFLQPYK